MNRRGDLTAVARGFADVHCEVYTFADTSHAIDKDGALAELPRL